MWGNFFGTQTAVTGAESLLSCFRENNISGLNYFIPNVNLYDGANGVAGYPRGQHSYVTDQSSFVDKGHWKRLPCSNDGNNSAATDSYYIITHSTIGDSTYWNQNTNFDGTELWHSAWLSNVKNLTILSTNFYNNLAAWELMDEPFNSTWHRDYASNQYSVSGHSAFCVTAEGADTRPKMVGTVASTNANSQYTSMSGAMGIIGGNAYGVADSTLWWTPNFVAWAYSKISTETEKMVIPWLWGVTTKPKVNMYFTAL